MHVTIHMQVVLLGENVRIEEAKWFLCKIQWQQEIRFFCSVYGASSPVKPNPNGWMREQPIYTCYFRLLTATGDHFQFGFGELVHFFSKYLNNATHQITVSDVK